MKRRAHGADGMSMEPPSSSLASWRHIADAIACALLGVVSFGGDRRVPLLEWIDLAIHESGQEFTY